MTSLARYVVQLEADSKVYIQKLSEANAELKRFHADQTTAIDGIKSAFTSLAGVISVAAITQFAKGQVEAAAQTYDLAKKLGTTTEYMSELRFVAKASSVDFETLTRNVMYLSRQIGEANRGNKDAQSTFNDLHISFAALAKIPLQDQIAVVVDRLFSMRNESERNAVAAKALGREQVLLQVAMEGGAKKLEEMRARAHELGATLTDEVGKGAKDAVVAMAELKSALLGVADYLLPKVLSGLTSFADGLRAIFTPSALQHFTAELEAQEGKVAELSKRLAELYKHQTAGDKPLGNLFGSYQPEIDDVLEKLVQARKELELTRAIVERIKSGNAPAFGVGDGGKKADPFAGLGLPNLAQLEEANKLLDELADKRLRGNMDISAGPMGKAPDLSQMQEAEDELTDIRRKGAYDRQLITLQETINEVEAAQEAASQVGILREGATNAAIGLLQTLGARHRGAAIAAIALEKGIAVARIIMYTHQAVMNAMATIPYPANIAVAAAVRVMGFTEAALVAATAAAQISQLSSGGTQATLGTAANPVATTSTGGSGASTAAATAPQGQKAVQIVFQGPVYGWDEFMRQRVVDSLRDLIDNRDVVIIGGDSRQAQELIGG